MRATRSLDAAVGGNDVAAVVLAGAVAELR